MDTHEIFGLFIINVVPKNSQDISLQSGHRFHPVRVLELPPLLETARSQQGIKSRYA